MQNCHCSRMIYGFWEAQLSAPVKTKISGQKFNATTYTQIFKDADEAWIANGGQTNLPAVVAAVTDKSSSSEGATSSSQAAPEVAAVSARGNGRGRGQNRGGRGNRGGGRGSYNNNQNNNSNQNQSNNQNNSSKPHQRGPKHPDLPSSAGWACAQHWKKGRGAPYCSDPLVCQWVRIVAPRQPQPSSSSN